MPACRKASDCRRSSNGTGSAEIFIISCAQIILLLIMLQHVGVLEVKSCTSVSPCRDVMYHAVIAAADTAAAATCAAATDTAAAAIASAVIGLF